MTPSRARARWAVAAAAGALAATGSATAAPLQVASEQNFSELSLENLMEIEVTSVSRMAEPLQEAPAAVFVITSEDIYRSGARTLPEVLRFVPGLHVARIGDINTYSVSSRGFADRLSDKLEVLIDGRSAYTPLFSGVFWDTLDTFLPDIERIEIVRGPGASLWGTNAITGVINIVTKHALGTHGGRLVTGAGTEERSFLSLRLGQAAGTAADTRFYVKEYERDALKDPNANDTFNVARFRQIGFRTDATPVHDQALTISADTYDGDREDLFEAPAKAGDVETSGGNVTTRWRWLTTPKSELTVQAYYDHSKRFIPAIVFNETRNIFDLDVQHHMPLGERQTLVYGAGYRRSNDETGGPNIAYIFFPPSETLDYYTGFVQDQVALGAGTELTLGSKFEHNDYTGWEAQPTARFGWRIDERWFTWTAVSRAVRTPNRLDRGLGVAIAGFGTFRSGNPDQTTEKLMDYEWGLRYSGAEFSADLTAFFNDYDDLRSLEADPGNPFGKYGNGVEGTGTGAELSLDWRPLPSLDVRLWGAALDLDLESKPGSTDTGTAQMVSGANPPSQAGLRIGWQPLPRWNADAFLRYVGRSSRNSPYGELKEYTELNLRVAWQVYRDLDLSLVGANLLDPQHGELRSPIAAAYVETPRTGRLELNWRWE